MSLVCDWIMKQRFIVPEIDMHLCVEHKDRA